MSSVKDRLVTTGIIKNVFDYQGLDPNLVDTYSYFEKKFQELLKNYADAYNLNNCFFYIKNEFYCNAFASKRQDYNIIGITNAYPILMKDKFDEKFFSNIIYVAFFNDKSISDAYADLYADSTFQFNSFMLDCSIQYTFSHEFRHLLQFNSSNLFNNFNYSENLDTTSFDIEKHVWEFDADRMAAYEVLKYVFSVHRVLHNKSDEKLLCLMYLALSSMFITKDLFHFSIMNQTNSEKYTINKQDFYTKKYSHPHPLVRKYNIFEFFHDNINADFPHLKLDTQQLLNNVLGISKLYFDALIPNQKEFYMHYHESTDLLGKIHEYNGELYDYAVKDESIKGLLSRYSVSLVPNVPVGNADQHIHSQAKAWERDKCANIQ